MSDVRYCPSCSAQVSASERFCGNCGARMDQPAPVAPTMPFGQQPPAQPPSFGVPPAGSPASFGVPANSTVTPSRRGIPVWAIILLAVVGLCAVGCVAAFALVTMTGQRVSQVFTNIQTEIASTPRPTGQGGGIVPIPTREGDTPTDEPATVTDEIPRPTAANIPTLAPTSTGGGIVGGVNADASAVRTAEAATAEAGQVAALIASSKEIFRDEFVDNRNRWFTGVFEDIETDTIEDGVFKVSWTAKGTSYELYEVRELTNFVAQVDCLVNQGGTDGSCSLVFAQKKDVGFISSRCSTTTTGCLSSTQRATRPPWPRATRPGS